MKTKTLILTTILLVSLSAVAQPTLTFRYANPKVLPGSPDIFQFDIEVKASETGSYHRDMQVYIDYDQAAFGENINRNGKVTITRLNLLDGEFSGVPEYTIVNTADNTSSRFAVFTESNFTGFVAQPSCFAHVPEVFNGFLRIRIDITDNTQTAGIKFNEELMNGGEYYQAASYPQSYTDPNLYENDLLNEPLTGTLGMENPDQNEGLTIYADGNTIYVNPAGSISVDVIVYNLTGQEIARKSFKNSARNKISIVGPEAYYIVKVITAKGIYTKKVFVR